MTKILVYDDTAKDIEAFCEANDWTEAELIDVFMGFLDVVKENNGLI